MTDENARETLLPRCALRVARPSRFMVMASSARPAKSYTQPKGRATTAQGDVDERGPRISATVEWIIVGLVIAAVVIAVFVYATGRESTNPGEHVGAPAPAARAELVIEI